MNVQYDREIEAPYLGHLGLIKFQENWFWTRNLNAGEGFLNDMSWRENRNPCRQHYPVKAIRQGQLAVEHPTPVKAYHSLIPYCLVKFERPTWEYTCRSKDCGVRP